MRQDLWRRRFSWLFKQQRPCTSGTAVVVRQATIVQSQHDTWHLLSQNPIL
jgi:hypothetical protein